MGLLRSFLFVFLALLVLAFGVLVGIDNSAPVSLIFLDWQSPALPLFVWVCLGLAVGFLLGVGLTGVGTLRQRHGRRQAERDLEAARRALKATRSPDNG